MRYSEYMCTKLTENLLNKSIDYDKLKETIKKIENEGPNIAFEESIRQEIERIINFVRFNNKNLSQKALEQVKIAQIEENEDIDSVFYQEERSIAKEMLNYMKVNFVGVRKILKRYDMKTKENLYGFYKPILRKELRYMKEVELYLVEIWEADSSNTSEGSMDKKIGHFRYLVDKQVANNMFNNILKRCNADVKNENENVQKSEQVYRIYFDNEILEMFHRKIEKSKNSFMLRMECKEPFENNKEITLHLLKRKWNKIRKFHIKIQPSEFDELIYGDAGSDKFKESNKVLKRIKSIVSFYKLKPSVFVTFNKNSAVNDHFEINHFKEIAVAELKGIVNVQTAISLINSGNLQLKKGWHDIIKTKSQNMVHGWTDNYDCQHVMDIDLKFSLFLYSRIFLHDHQSDMPEWVIELNKRLIKNQFIKEDANAIPVYLNIRNERADFKTYFCFAYFVFFIGILASVSLTLNTYFYTMLAYFMLNMSVFMGAWLLWSIYKQRNVESANYKIETVIPFVSTIACVLIVVLVFYAEL